MVINRRRQHDHDGELGEEHAVEDERFGFVPCLEPLRDDVAARIDGEGREAGGCDGREFHRDGW